LQFIWHDIYAVERGVTFFGSPGRYNTDNEDNNSAYSLCTGSDVENYIHDTRLTHVHESTNAINKL